jgi:hypothetical protein
MFQEGVFEVSYNAKGRPNFQLPSKEQSAKRKRVSFEADLPTVAKQRASKADQKEEKKDAIPQGYAAFKVKQMAKLLVVESGPLRSQDPHQYLSDLEYDHIS